MKVKVFKHTLVFSSVFMGYTHAEMYFPTELLSLNGSNVADLAHFKADGTQVAGEYSVDVYLNKKFIAKKKIRFDEISNARIDVKDDTGLVPCLNRKDLEGANVKVALYPELMAGQEDQCVMLGTVIPAAFTSFDFGKMRLDISVPQASVHNQARGYIKPELWDDGINAALLNYRFNSVNNIGDYKGESHSLQLNGGVNIGPWRLRDSRAWNYKESFYGHRQQWQRLQTYAERSVIPLRSNLTLGESVTNSQVFKSLAFTGVKLATDDNMYPDTMRGFAPVVRGVAESNAEVSIRQNGYNVYTTTVSPGEFEINDLTPMYSSGDLEVTVKEVGGNSRVFIVPYASVPALQREGRIKYGLTAGRLRTSSDRYETPNFAEGTLMWGLPHGITTYGGVQYSTNYMAVQSGLGVDLGRLGAVSVDVTHADSTLVDGSEHQGQSLQFLYAHAFKPTGTTFRLTGYQYSTQGFYTLEETALKKMRGYLNDYSDKDSDGNLVATRPYNGFDFYNLYNEKRSRLEANISQRLGKRGSVYLSGVKQTYWNSKSRNYSLQAGYSSSWGPVSYSLGYSYSDNTNDVGRTDKDNRFNFSMSLPLESLFASTTRRNRNYANYNMNHSKNGSSQHVGLNGSLFDDSQLSWNVSQARSAYGENSGSAGLNYKGSKGAYNVGYSYDRDNQSVSYGMSGGLIVHGNGVTFGQVVGDSSVLVAAKGASGVNVLNESGVKTDWRGYAIKPYASAYRENRVALDMRSIDDDKTEIEGGVTSVVPTKGAIVRADFAVRQGQRVLMTLTHQGKPVPFGTMVMVGENSGIVNDSGQVYLSGLENSGEVMASWGQSKEQQCQASFKLNEAQQAESVVRITTECH